MDMEESHNCGRLGSGGERNAEEHVSQHLHRGNGKIQEWVWGSKDQEESTAGLVRQNS